jgi:Fic family protein/DNA-binding XRE family transcriptional regulator
MTKKVIYMKSIIKSAREKKGLLVREVAKELGIDQALVSKFETGSRKPTREQIVKLAAILDINTDELIVAWLKDKILDEIGRDELALKAMIAAEEVIRYESKTKPVPKKIKSLISAIDKHKAKLDKLRTYDSYRIAQALELEYTFESNRIEGNTLTLKETDLVINEGLTISGKSMREHLEAINHKEAIEYVKYLVENKSSLNERELLTIHNLILRGIDPANAGRYRNVQVMIKGSSHMPPAPYIVPKQMEDYFIWYETHKNKLHPVVLAAEMHERLVTIHPFIDGNGRTSRLVMNLILLKHGFVIANIKGDAKSRMAYYNALEKVQTGGDKNDFIELVATYELEAIERYVSILSK